MNTKPIVGVVVCVSMFLLYAPALQADWTFVMMGDTRGDDGTTTTGISPYLNTIAQKIGTLSPDLVLVAGDLINGDLLPSGSPLWSYAIQYANWKTAMQPVFDYSINTGIPIYPVRGNHDNCHSETAPIPDLKQAYYDAFSPYVPANGPNTISSGDQRGFSYSFTYNNATFVVADEYFYYNQTPGQDGYHELDQAWVTQQLHDSSSAYKVLMGHVPFFMTQGHDSMEHFFGETAAGYANRTNFWNTMGTNGLQLYVTGHVHNESVARTTNDYGNSIIQLMAGNGGGPPDPISDRHDPGVEMLYTNELFGFSLATVGAAEMTIQYYSLNTNDSSWAVASYVTSISPNQAVPEASSAMLLAPAMMALMTGRSRKRRRG
ncbi:MAG: metallophosphoesterase [Verrucomicrobia bacterium]|nr:metallophosphoesterase [Verrucomicrobiota bacterium]